MKSIVIETPGHVALVEAPRPTAPKGHALLKVLYGGICGSDVGTYKGTFLYAQYPRIPGHEFSAQIVSVEDNKYGLKPGMIVTCNPYFNCGTCYSCQRGNVNCCMSNQTMGAQRDGAFSEYLSMPLERIYDGKGLDAKRLALIEPFCISYHAVKRAAVQMGQSVLVVGGGTIGYLAAAAAKMRGARVFVSDVDPHKLACAKELGVDGVILNTDTDAFSSEVAAATNGNGFDVCIEAVGLPATFQACINAAAFRGKVVVVGIGKQSLDFFYSVIQTKELDVFGSRNAKKEDFQELIDFVLREEFDLLKIVTAEYSYTEAGAAFAKIAQDSSVFKILLDFSGKQA